MKFVKFTAVALFVALAMTSCLEEKVSFSDEELNTTTNMGLLSISNLAVDCRVVENTPDGSIDPATSTASTRATRAVDANTFDCSIINEENEVVMSFKFGERPTEAVELETGDYIFKIQSGDVPGAAWESPVYGSTKPFKIVRNETTEISEIVCSLLQIQVSISYSQDLLERLGDKTLTTVKVGNNSLEYSLGETRSGFFLAPQLNNTIEISISGTYAADLVTAKPINMTKEIRDVKAGQYSKVHFYIEHSADGNINVSATIRDWVVDEIIPCNVADLIREEEWKEESDGGNEGETNSGLSVEWIGYDIAQRVTITEETTGEIMIYADKGIKELVVRIDSQSLAAILPTVGLVDVINLSYPEKSYDSANPDKALTPDEVATLKKMLAPVSAGGLLGFPYGDDIINKTEILFSITDFMGALAAFSGNHDFHFSITDNEGKTITPSLMLTSN